MGWFRIHSVRRKLFLMLLATNILVLVAAGSALLYYDLNEHRNRTASTIGTMADILGQGTAAALEFNDPESAKEKLTLLSANPNILAANIYTAEGDLFASYVSSAEYQHDKPRLGVDRHWFEGGELAVTRRVTTDHGLVGTVHIREQFDLSAWLIKYLMILGVILAISLALGLIVSSQFQRWIAGPIERISALARQVMEERNYRLRATKSTEDEVGHLAEAFNGMLDALEREIDERTTAEKEVRTLNTELEHRVADRTAELQVTNQKLLVRTDEAEAANRAKADFLSNMSHEIRTPMNAILGLAYLLEQSALDRNAQDLVKKIRSAGRSLQSIINDILDFSKIEAGRLEIEHSPFHLDEVLDNVAGIMSSNVREDDVEFVISPSPFIEGQLFGDALRLEQILINLTSNAIKFTKEGAIVVDIRLIAQSDREVQLRFSVRDTGVGISLDKQANIFSAFTQEDVSTTRRFGGTGLGLTICRHLVTGMGGEIGVNSEPGKGSEFWFTLPFEVREAPDEHASEMKALEVLIVDHTDITSKNLSRIVGSFGWKSTRADSTDTAIEKIRKKQEQNGMFDILLIDWKMPGSDGLNVAQQIIDAFERKVAPLVLMVSSHARDTVLQHPTEKVVDGILSKPVTSSALYNMVGEVIMKPRGTMFDNAQAPGGAKGVRVEGVRALVVDDSETNREVAMRILMTEGAQVEAVDEGEAAVEWIRDHPGEVDVVLMDVQMPIMDGYEATQKVRELPQGAKLPIIALTAGISNAQIMAAREAGMDSFVSKPFNVDELIGTIQKLTNFNATGGAPAARTDGQSSDSQVPAPNDFPGINIEQGLDLWGEEEAYQKFLKKFSIDYAQTKDKLSEAIAENDYAAAKASAHKLKGAAGNLALVDVASAAARLETALGESRDDGLEQLASSLDTAFSSIQEYVAEPRPDEGVLSNGARNKAIQLLSELSAALDADSPDYPDQLIGKLTGVLPESDIHPLRERIDDFDFRGAEIATHELMSRLSHDLKE